MEWSHRNKTIVTFLALAISSTTSFVSVPILVSYFGIEHSNPDKIVIAPSKWFNDPTINTKDLLPDSWIQI